MRIIDAHLHLFPETEPQFEEMARSVGHHNSTEHLRQAYGELGIVHGVVMGNRSLRAADHDYPADLFHYCVGLDSSLVKRDGSAIPHLAERIEENLAAPNCCGVKLYPGYNRIWLSDPMYEPVYALAAHYRKPVTVHMGLTSFSNAHLKTPSSSCATSATPSWSPPPRWWRRTPTWPRTSPDCWRAGWTWSGSRRSRRAG